MRQNSKGSGIVGRCVICRKMILVYQEHTGYKNGWVHCFCIGLKPSTDKLGVK